MRIQWCSEILNSSFSKSNKADKMNNNNQWLTEWVNEWGWLNNCRFHFQESTMRSRETSPLRWRHVVVVQFVQWPGSLSDLIQPSTAFAGLVSAIYRAVAPAMPWSTTMLCQTTTIANCSYEDAGGEGGLVSRITMQQWLPMRILSQGDAPADDDDEILRRQSLYMIYVCIAQGV